MHQEVVCDGVKDCVDGTDEDSRSCVAVDCEDQECSQCRFDRSIYLSLTDDRWLKFKIFSPCFRDQEFACENGRQCLPLAKACDGTRHCADASDESAKLCEAREYVRFACII